jgi:hypothetical protein
MSTAAARLLDPSLMDSVWISLMFGNLARRMRQPRRTCARLMDIGWRGLIESTQPVDLFIACSHIDANAARACPFSARKFWSITVTLSTTQRTPLKRRARSAWALSLDRKTAPAGINSHCRGRRWRLQPAVIFRSRCRLVVTNPAGFRIGLSMRRRSGFFLKMISTYRSVNVFLPGIFALRMTLPVDN